MIRRSRHRSDTADPRALERRGPADAATPPQAVLALQRTAGNAAVTAMLAAGAPPARRSLARVSQGQISDRAVGIWEEKGEPRNQTAEQQGADWAEATRQTGAMERETGRRAHATSSARGGESTAEQMREDWLGAEKSIAKDFICERSDDWGRLMGRAKLWTTGVPPGVPATELDAIKAKIRALWTDVSYNEDLAVRAQLIDESEALIDAWITAHGGANQAKADQLLMLKMHTLAYERRRRLKMKKIEDKYAIKISGRKGMQAAKAAFAPGATLTQIANVTGVSIFSLEELDMLSTVLERYGPLLGSERGAALGPQPLSHFSRNKVGLNPGANPATDAPVASPGDFGVTIRDTISMYDKANRDTLDFLTKPQQFRGTIEHELSHALIEPLLTAGGDTMLQKFADDMKFWDGDVNATVYRGANDAATKAAAQADGAEAPPTDYGQTNAEEDLAETMMFFFEDPGELETRCPVRHRWVRENLGKVLSKEHLDKLPPMAGPGAGGSGDAEPLLAGLFG